MDRIFHHLFRKLACLAIFTLVYTTVIQPAILGLSFPSQNILEVAELFWGEGPQEEKQEKDNMDRKIDLSIAGTIENPFVYRTQMAIHNARVSVPLFISAIRIPPPEQI
jgi:hypothetical protein